MQNKPILNIKIALNFDGNASKIKKRVLSNMTFILSVVLEKGIVFVKMGLIF